MSFGTIWSYPNNPRVMKIQAVASLNNLTIATPDFKIGTTNREPAFLAKFPLGKVPAFEGADGLKLTESDAIAQYVAESGPAAGQLLGSTVAERAVVRQWICFADGEVQNPILQMLLPRFGFKAFDESVEASALEKLERALEYVEGYLKDRTWLATETLSLADISLAASLYWGFSMVIDQEMRKKYPFVVSWYEKTVESEGVKQAFGEKKFVEKRETPKA